MAYNDLRDWINTLHTAGELKRITQEVDPILEMAEIADRAAKMGKGTAKAGGPALLFENVKGYPGAKVLLSEVRANVLHKLVRAGVIEQIGTDNVIATLALALVRAKAIDLTRPT